MRADPTLFEVQNAQGSKEPRYTVAIDFDGTIQHFTSHDDIANVPGTPITDVLRGISATSQTLNPDRANATIGSMSFDLVDLNEQFTDTVRDELLNNGVGLRGRTVSFFIGYKDLDSISEETEVGSGGTTPDFDEFVLFQTQVIREVETKDGRYSVKCADIQRETKKRIFEPVRTYLTSSISETDTTIPVLDASGFEGNAHGTSYTDAPSQDVIYIKLDKTKEIIRCPTADVVGNSFTNVTRGALGTKAERVDVDPAAQSDRRPKVDEYVYLELPAIKLAWAILTGEIYGTADTLPSGWHAGIDTSFVRESDFTGIGTDLWDTTDDTNGIVLRFEGTRQQDAKKFLETEVYLLLGLFSPVYADGQLGLKRMLASLADSPHSDVLDRDNIASTGRLIHDMESMQNNLRVDWNYNGTRFLRSTIIVDSNSISKHGTAPEKRMRFEGLAGTRFTEQVLRQLLTSLRDMYTGPPLRLTVNAYHYLNRIEIGDALFVDVPNIRDYSQSGSNLQRTMVVHGMTVDWLKGVRFKMFGSSERADEIPPVEATECLPDAFYSSEGASLSTIPGLMSGNATNAGTFTLSGGADMNAAANIFYWDNDLTISSGTTLIIEDNVQLRVQGFLTINGTIDGDENGLLPGTSNFDSGQHYYWRDDINVGTPGFIGNSETHFGLLHRVPDDGGIPDWVWVTGPYRTEGQYDAFPNIILEVSDTGNGSITGIPTDMRGGGGAHGPRAGRKQGISGRSFQEADGGAGGQGGGALCIVSRGGDFGVSGLITLNGEDSTSPVSFYNAPRYDIYGGAGGAGAPGALLWLLDGSSVTFPDIAGKFSAVTGEVPAPFALPYLSDTPGQGSAASQNRSLSQTNAPQDVQAPYMPSAIRNYDQSNVNFRISYLPCDITPEPDQDEDVPPPTNLTAIPFSGGTEIDWDNPGLATFDHIEVWVANSNSRAAASLLLTTVNSRYIEINSNIQRERYYWVRAVDADGNVSEFEPSTTTTTAVAYPQIGQSAIPTDPFIRLGEDNWVFINDGAEPDAIAQYVVGVGTDGTDAIELQNDVDIINNIGTSAITARRRGPDVWDAEAFPGQVIEIRARMQHIDPITTNPFAPKTEVWITTEKEDGTNGRSYQATGGKFWNTAGDDGTWFDMVYTAYINNEPVDDEPRYIRISIRTNTGFVFQQHVYIDFLDATTQNSVFGDDTNNNSPGVGSVPQIIASRSGRYMNDAGGWTPKPGGMAMPSWTFDNTTTSGDPGAGFFRLDNATPASVTNIYISSDEADGYDADTILGFLSDGDVIYIDDGSTILRDRTYVFTVNGTPTDNTGWWTIPVTVQQSDTQLSNDQTCSFNIQFMSLGTGGGGGVTSFEGRTGAVVATAGDYADVAETFTAEQTFTASETVFESAQPKIRLHETDAPVDEGNWLIRTQGGTIGIFTATDAAPETVVNNVFQVQRTGTVVDEIRFPINAVDEFVIDRQGSTNASAIAFANDDGFKGYVGFLDDESFSVWDTSVVQILNLSNVGDLQIDGRMTVELGSVGAPAYSFFNDNDSGMYSSGGTLGFSANGALVFQTGPALVRSYQHLWSSDGFSVQGTVNDQGQSGPFAFVDIAAAEGRFGTFNYDTGLWEPTLLQGNPLTINAVGGSLGFEQGSVERMSLSAALFEVNVLLNVSETGSYTNLTTGPWTGGADRYVNLESVTNLDNLEYSLAVAEGANNRRARFFLSDETGEFGLQGSASSGVPNFGIYVGNNRVFAYDDSLDEWQLYTGGTDAQWHMGRNAGERVTIEVQDGNGFFIYEQDEVDATSHVFTFRIDSSNTGARRFQFEEDILVDDASLTVGDINQQSNIIIDGNGTLILGTSNRSNGFAHIRFESMGSGPGSPADGDMYYVGSDLFLFSTGVGAQNLTAGADTTADETVTGQWTFNDAGGGEAIFIGAPAIRVEGTGVDSNSTQYIVFENSIGTEFGRVGKDTSGGAYMEVSSGGNLHLLAGGLQQAEVLISAAAGALGGNIILEHNGVGPGRVHIRNENGDYWTLEHDGTNAIINDPAALTAALIIDGMSLILEDQNFTFRNGSNTMTFNPGTTDVVISGTGMDALRFDTIHIEMDDNQEIRFGNSQDVTLDFNGTNLLLTGAVGTPDLLLSGIDINMQDESIIRAVLQDYAIEYPALITVSANAFTATYSDGPAFIADLEAATGTVTGTLSGGPPAGTYGQITIRVQQDGTAARTLNWAGGTFRWAGGTAHPLTTTLNGFSIYTFETWDGGANWYGGGADYS